MDEFQEKVSLKNLSNFRIGGLAQYFRELKTTEELAQAIRVTKENKLPFYVLGDGTNILWSDDGFPGLVLKLNFNFIEIDGLYLVAGSSVRMPALVNAAIGRGLAGLEWAGGLPGTFGGAIYGNAGAFGGEIKDVVEEVVSLDVETLEVKKRSNRECGFEYRSSLFKKEGREIIVEATLKLRKGDKLALYEGVIAKINYRRKKHPLDYPNIGSIFKNVAISSLDKRLVEPHRAVIKTDPFPVIPAAYLIDKAGLKGISCGGAMISPRHPNFIINILDAKASDVLTLIKLIKEKVREKFNIELEEEVRIIK